MVSSPRLPTGIRPHHPLAPLTTLEVGGTARFYAEVSEVQHLREACLWAYSMDLSTLILGEGSNLLVADTGFPGLALRWRRQGVQVLQESSTSVLVRVEGGTTWDDWVGQAVTRDWAGVECLSGIPGCVGASPIQNIGAYGQEVAETIEAVEVMDRRGGEVTLVTREQCRFAYRHSAFKGPWKDRYVVTAVNFRLHPGGRPTLRYGDLTRALGEHSQPTLGQVRQAVLQVRRNKSMVRDLADPNHRSAGSFFMNPVVSAALAEELAARFAGEKMPRYPADPQGDPGQVKLSAAWLIERAGFTKGYQRGRAGLSTKHVLALVNRGGATSQEVVELAGEIRRKVCQDLGVVLEPEAQLVGFTGTPAEWSLGT